MPKKNVFEPGDGPFQFKVKLEGVKGMEATAIRPPFEVPVVFGTKGRVPVRGTVNGFPFRTSLCNMGDGHLIGLNKQMREGAGCKAGDVVHVVLQRDREERVVDVADYIKKTIASNQMAQATWESLSFTHKKEWVRAIEQAKKEETRQSRMKKMIDTLKKGKRVGF